MKIFDLTKEERTIEESIERDEFRSVANMEEEVARITNIFKDFAKKDKSITLRINSSDLNTIKQKARESGLPYQTLIGIIFHKYAVGEIDVKL